MKRLFDSHFNRYKELLTQLYDNLEFYAGTFTLTSYTQTKQWTVYSVNRGTTKELHKWKASSMFTMTRCGWCELLESYHITGEQRYLEKAEYLMNTCSTVGIALLMNKAIRWEASHGDRGISPSTLVATVPLSARWCGFMKFTKEKSDEVTYGYVAADNSRKLRTRKNPTIIWVLPKPFMIGKETFAETRRSVRRHDGWL